jgi:hypothetical protein
MNPANQPTDNAHRADPVQVGVGRLSIEEVVWRVTRAKS